MSKRSLTVLCNAVGLSCWSAAKHLKRLLIEILHYVQDDKIAKDNHCICHAGVKRSILSTCKAEILRVAQDDKVHEDDRAVRDDYWICHAGAKRSI